MFASWKSTDNERLSTAIWLLGLERSIFSTFMWLKKLKDTQSAYCSGYPVKCIFAHNFIGMCTVHVMAYECHSELHLFVRWIAKQFSTIRIDKFSEVWQKNKDYMALRIMMIVRCDAVVAHQSYSIDSPFNLAPIGQFRCGPFNKYHSLQGQWHQNWNANS